MAAVAAPEHAADPRIVAEAARARRPLAVLGLPESSLVVAVGLPLFLIAFGLGLGSDVPAWAAPWALATAACFVLGDRLGSWGAAGAACVAVVLGPVAVLGVAGGATAGALGRRLRPAFALAAGLVAMVVALVLMALA